MKNDTVSRPVSFAQVDINGGFWQRMQDTDRRVTAWAVRNRFEETGRFEAMKCNWREGMEHKPHIFWDSDIAKWMEGVAYLIQKAPCPELEAVVEDTIDSIENNMDKNGCFNSYFQSVELAMRWQDRSRHELYCAGHLMEAAVAWKNATGRDRFLRLMCRYADEIYRVFVGEGSAAFVTPGHEEIELALVKLYRATENEKYLELAKFFIDRRGNNDREEKSIYNQSHLPVRQQFTAEGHAVRACYLYSGMADLARETGDEALKDACEKLFDNITEKRMYITAGIGSAHYQEAFTADYDLPNETAYTETCASIALAYFAQRLLLLRVDRRYADTVERVLYNGFLSGVSLSGDRFFYTNPLEINLCRQRKPDDPRFPDWLPVTQRVKVFSCSCCPPNAVRFLASVGDYAFTENDAAVYLHQFMNCTAKIGDARVTVETDYPVSGRIRVKADGLKGRLLGVRIPGWCRKYEVSTIYNEENGYIMLSGDGIDAVITLDMTPRPVAADPRVIDDIGKAAVMRGPVVYCMEGVDNGENIQSLYLDADAVFAEKQSDAFGTVMLETAGFRRNGCGAVYGEPGGWTDAVLRLIPYYAFANRGETDMRVWIPVRG